MIRYMKSATKEQALKAARKMLGNGHTVAIYQFPNGQWGYASSTSGIYTTLSESDHIYPGVVARSWWVEYT